MAEAAEAAGLADDERYALTQLTRLAPEDTAYAERLQQLGGADEAAAEELPSFEAAGEGAQESTEFGFSEFAISNEDNSSQMKLLLNGILNRKQLRLRMMPAASWTLSADSRSKLWCLKNWLKPVRMGTVTMPIAEPRCDCRNWRVSTSTSRKATRTSLSIRSIY
jgi:hypothetical protein